MNLGSTKGRFNPLGHRPDTSLHVILNVYSCIPSIYIIYNYIISSEQPISSRDQHMLSYIFNHYRTRTILLYHIIVHTP